MSCATSHIDNVNIISHIMSYKPCKCTVYINDKLSKVNMRHKWCLFKALQKKIVDCFKDLTDEILKDYREGQKEEDLLVLAPPTTIQSGI